MLKTIFYLTLCLFILPPTVFAADQKPLFKDFMGLNGHFKFKPELYKQTCRLVRNYHNVNWDVKNLGDPITIPSCPNKVNWKNHVYGPWKKHGFETDICIQFSGVNHEAKDYIKKWNDNSKWTYEYGKKLSQYFGPSGKEKLCTSIEFGNEPGKRFDDETYKKQFIQFAKGVRDGDPKIKIVTATAHARAADNYSKDLRQTFSDPEIKSLYDVINIHTYAQVMRKNNSESPWDRSYPEDESLEYLKVVDETLLWRDKHAKGKEVWITEFGYDCVTEEAMEKRTGWFKKLDWQGTTDLQQAQYIIRSFFAFAERDIDRAYIYFFDDDNKPSVHAAGGLTRLFKPKMSFWAVKQMYEMFGEYRFNKIIKKENKNAYVYEFVHGENEGDFIWAAWSPTGTQTNKKENYKARTALITLDGLPALPQSIQRMTTKDGKGDDINWKKEGKNSISVEIGESPIYIKILK